ncbi:MAG: 30S ribosomal protein S16 [Legionellales bacterium]|nr:30S ribosomal protein S16 [Legionellales bacterium]
MVVIRLARGGANKRPFYRVVAADKRSPRDGKFIEKLGYFNPLAQGQAKRFELNVERINHWLAHGAQPSNRVVALLKEHRKAAAATPIVEEESAA